MSMPLTLEELQDIQSTAMADDVEIELAKMTLWTAEQATEFFESGGTKEPTAAAGVVTDISDTTAAASAPDAAEPPLPALGRKPRVALLHGTASNEKVFTMQMSSLLHRLKEDGVECYVVEGGEKVLESNAQLASVKSFFGDEHTYLEYTPVEPDSRGWKAYPGLDKAVGHIEARLAEKGGADVLIGFSQGANLASCVVARAELGLEGVQPRDAAYRGVVLLSVNEPGWIAQRPAWFARSLRTPCLIGSAEGDTVAKTGPDVVSECFAPNRVRRHHHSGPGHRPLPRQKDELVAMAEVVRAFVKEVCAAGGGRS
jgi:predicted esterase